MSLWRAFAGWARGFGEIVGFREAGLLIGLGLLAYGAWLVFPPAGFLLPGIIIVYVAIAGLR